jgi:choline dehydrogenase
VALRGQPADYNDWFRRGNPGWSFQDVLPYFRLLEHDLDIANDYHGRKGPIPIRRPANAELIPIQRAFLNASLNAGYPYRRP